MNMVRLEDSKLAPLEERLEAHRTDNASFLTYADGDCSISPRFGKETLPVVNPYKTRGEGSGQDRRWLRISAAAANCARYPRSPPQRPLLSGQSTLKLFATSLGDRMNPATSVPLGSFKPSG